jgi:hypothetical protein
MQNSGDDSVLHRLARCFGQGLALGVGFTLTQQALRPKGTLREPALDPPAPPRPAVKPPAPPRAAAPAHSQLDLRTVQAIVSVVEQRIQERAAQTERKLDEIKAAAAANVETAVSRRVEKEMTGVRTQVVKTQREFAEAVARIVAQQVSVEVARQTAAIETRVQQRIEAAVAPLRNELRELRQRLAETENMMHEFATAISDTVRMAGQRGAAPESRREAANPAESAPRTAAVRTSRTRSAPQHHDLRVLRQRLMAPERGTSFPPPLLQPPVPRRQPQVVPFRVAS